MHSLALPCLLIATGAFAAVATSPALSMPSGGWCAEAPAVRQALDNPKQTRIFTPAGHLRVDFEIQPRLSSFMALLQIEASVEVLATLNDLRELHLIRSTVQDLGAGRYRIAGYGPEAVVPQLEARGCAVQVLMTSEENERFHSRVDDAVRSPEERRDRQEPRKP
jgi:hypothetical protein